MFITDKWSVKRTCVASLLQIAYANSSSMLNIKQGENKPFYAATATSSVSLLRLQGQSRQYSP
jgi:hypothetical protein